MNVKTSIKLLSEMAAVSRFSQTILSNKESVLEHTGFVGMMAYIIAMSIEERYHFADIDYKELMSKAMVHDVDEVITGDIPRPTKYYNKEIHDCIEKVSEENIETISIDLLGNNKMLETWKNSKVGPEGSIVALADALAIVYKAYDESVLRGNKTIKGHVENIPTWLSSCVKKVEDHFSVGCLGGLYSDAISMCDEISKS